VVEEAAAGVGAGDVKLVSVKRTPSCKRVGPIALLRHDQALKEGVDEVAKTDPRTCA